MTDWTTDTLKEHLEAILVEKDKALAAALVAVKEENRKTEIAAEKRFDLLNELRQGVATAEQLEALEKLMGALSQRLTRLESSLAGRTQGTDKTLGYIMMAFVVVNIIIGLIVAFR